MRFAFAWQAGAAPSRTLEAKPATMRAVLQRVSAARVEVEGRTVGAIGQGLLVLVCAEPGDGETEVDLFARKIAGLRVFDDDAGRMNRALGDVNGGVLLVSQFTLAGDWRRGNRPDFSGAAPPNEARRTLAALAECLKQLGVPVATGEFGARMAVHLVNDGPVTLWMDSRHR